MTDIHIRGARLHNLKHVTLTIPKRKLVVFTGVSGSGKSTLAFDLLHKESLRQYFESIGMVSFGLAKPPVDEIRGLSPSISIEQGLTNHSPRSTVGTATEVFTYLRVLYARVGRRPCPRCGGAVPPGHTAPDAGLWDEEESSDAGDTLAAAQTGAELPVALPGPAGLDPTVADRGGPDRGRPDPAAQALPVADADAGWVACPHCGAHLPALTMAHFSFNKPAGACPTCTGLGTVFVPDVARLFDEEKSVLTGGVIGWNPPTMAWHAETLRRAARHYGFEFDPRQAIRALGDVERDLLLYGVLGEPFARRFPNVEPPATVGKGRFEGVIPILLRRHAEHAADAEYLEKLERVLQRRPCPACDGARLRPAARAVTVAGRPLVAGEQDPDGDQAAARLPLTALAAWLDALLAALPSDDWPLAEPVLADLRQRVQRLLEVGLGYLTCERTTPSLSAGEAQRLRLAALLGSGLTGVLYVLDEPTVGLHPRDTARLVAMLRALRDLDNTVLVIEHDLDLIAAADWVVDFGPGGGRTGGEIVAQGTPATVMAAPASVTGRYLSGAASVPVPATRRAVDAPADGPALTVYGARAHNLHDLTVRFPLRDAAGAGLLVAVTGVSGSGKSTLLFDVLDRAARRHFYAATTPPGEHDRIEGWEHLDRIITVDQAPLARSTRSNAATYTDAFTPIRELFAAQAAIAPDAQAHNLTAQHFSFNVPGGRCDRCEGAGVLSVGMHFLPDVLVRCPVCHGRRYRPEVLAVRYRGYDIAQVLEMTIAEALALFAGVRPVETRLALLAETGLGYLPLGQTASTFSGGEAQRVKLARELARRVGSRTLYLLDEPTTGLHPADTAHLLSLLRRLTDAGSTVLVIEHNLDVVRAADWVIDLGPEGGAAGGRLLAAGPPAAIIAAGTATGHMLAGMAQARPPVR